MIARRESLSTLVKRVFYTYDTTTVSANVGVNLSPNNSPIPNGYVPFSVEFVSTGNTNVSIRGYNAYNGQVFVHNDTSSAQSATPSLYVWCVKTSVV